MSGIDTPTALDYLFIGNTARDYMAELNARLYSIETNDVVVSQLSDLSDDLGNIYNGNFIAGEGDPFDQVAGLFTGAAMCYPPVTIGADDYNIFGENAGVLEFGLSATNGKAYFAAGAGIIDHEGVTLRAEVWPATTYIQWKAQDTGGVVGNITVAYAGAAVNTGVIVSGIAHDSGVRGYVALWAKDYTDTLKSYLVIDTNGSATLDFTAVTLTAGGGGLGIRTTISDTAAVNNVLYLYTYSTGTPAAGLGTGVAFGAENSSGTITGIGYASVSYITTTAGSEDSKVILGMLRKGVSYPLPIGAPTADQITQTGNITTGETDLFSWTVLANLLAQNGDKLTADFTIATVSHATATRQIRVYFGGTVIYDTAAITTTPAGRAHLHVLLMRTSSTNVKAVVTIIASAALGAAPALTYTVVTATLSNSQIFKITGQAAAAGAATDDILLRFATAAFIPAA